MTLVVPIAALAAALYLVAAARTRWPRRRTAAYLAGVAVAAAAIAVDPTSLRMHMVEHALLSILAAPLIVVGSPLTLLIRALPRHRRPPLLAMLRSRPARIVTDPAFTWPAFIGLQWMLHVSPFFPQWLAQPPLEVMEHVLFLCSGILFFLPVLGRQPIAHPLRGASRFLYVFLALPTLDLMALWYIITARETLAVAMMFGMLPLGMLAFALGCDWVLGEERRMARWEAYSDALR